MGNKTLKIRFLSMFLVITALIIGVSVATDTRPVLLINGKAYFGYSAKISCIGSFTKKDLKSLKYMRNLKKAAFIVDELDLEILRRMNNLRELTIGFRGDYYIYDWTALNSFKKLEYFNGLNLKMTDLSAFKNMHNLKILYIESVGAANLKTSIINDISDVKSLTKLERFSISGKNITDISCLSNLLELKELSLFGTNCDNYSILLKLPKLEHLSIDKGVLTEKEIKMFEEKGVSVTEYEREVEKNE